MDTKLQQDVRFLKAYSVVITLLLMVDAQGTAKLEFLDEKGATVQVLPAPAKANVENKTKP